jgi:hypothetical protein
MEYIKINGYSIDAIVYMDNIHEYLKLINIYNPKVVFKHDRHFLFFDNNGICYEIVGNYENLYDMYLKKLKK